MRLDEGADAEFRCEVDANPFDATTVTWELPDRPGSKSEKSGNARWGARTSLNLASSIGSPGGFLLTNAELADKLLPKLHATAH